MGVKSLLLCDEEVCNRRRKSLQLTKMISIKPTSSRLLLSGTTQRPVRQQFIAPNALISLLFIVLLRTSSVLSVQISDGVDIPPGDDQTQRVQSSSGSRPRILSRGTEDDVSLFDEITHSQESTSPGKRDDLISRRRSASRLLMMTNRDRGYTFTAAPAAAAASTSGPDELNALLAIKKSFVDDSGILASWTSNSGNKNKNSSFSHCRTWVGVTCNSLHQVVGINLPAAAGMQGTLGGTISPVFGSLKQLVVLDLSNNLLEGGIPSELGELPRLQVLWLSGNAWNSNNVGLNGSIPASLGNCTSLHSLDLNSNGFSGNIPPSIGWCQNLTYLDVSYNNLIGSIPSSIGDLKQLQTLILEDNQLTGTIPPSIGNHSQLQYLSIANNTISGNISSNIGWCQNLKYLDVSDNNLIGSIPSSIGDLKQLQTLYFYSNQLTGNIPSSLGNLQNLTDLELGNNNLMGPIPTTLGNLTQLQTLKLYTNNLTGVIPTTLGSLKELEYMDLSNNDFSIDMNTIPSSFCNLASLISLSLTGTYLSGSIPTCLGKLSFTYLDLSFNNLTGPIPPLSNARPEQVVLTVILSNNRLTGPIPNEFGNLSFISELDLSGNRLSGSIPDFIFQWQLLYNLDLSNNMFTGKFPLASPKYNDSYSYSMSSLDISDNYLNSSVSLFLSNLYSTPWGKGLQTLQIGGNLFYGPLQLDFSLFKSLGYFSATGNQITGPIPLDFGTKGSSIVLIDLSHNQLTGDICLGLEPQVATKTLSALRVLTLAHNKLIGPIPLWITRLKSLQVLDLSFNSLTGSIPSDLHSLLGYKILSSNPGGLNGFTLYQNVGLRAQEYTDTLLTTTYMDLSSNALTGDIPPSIMELSGLLYLYLSNNKLTGNIPTSLGNMSQLERLDFSCNNLIGEIPSNLRSLTFLEIFNVSSNNLSGPIPIGGQLMGFPKTSYLPGNDGLCGEVIHRLCNSTPQAPEPHVLKEAVSYEDLISLPGFLIGVGVGFFSVAFSLLYWQHGEGLYLSNARYNKPLNRQYGAFKHPC